MVKLSVILKIGFVLLGLLVMLFAPRGESSETWRLKVHYGKVNETICAHYNFLTEDSCQQTKVWFEEVTEWHGQNTYKCVLDNECQQE